MLVFKEQFGSQVSCSHYVNSYISTAREEHECLKQSVTHAGTCENTPSTGNELAGERTTENMAA